jgi:hypothetical protein
VHQMVTAAVLGCVLVVCVPAGVPAGLRPLAGLRTKNVVDTRKTEKWETFVY